MYAIAEGVLFGGLVIFLVGPVFLALVQTSIVSGPPKALSFAVGVWISDLVILLLAWYGIAQIGGGNDYKTYLGMAGGVVLIGFGLFSIFKNDRNSPDKRSGPNKVLGRGFIKGFAFNGFNPMVLIFWSGLLGYELVNYGHQDQERIFFFAGLLLTMIAGDLIKIYFASKLRSVLKPNLISNLNRGVGVLLVFLGARLLYLSVTDSFPI